MLTALHWAKSHKLIDKHVWDDCRDLCPLKDGEAGARPGRKRKRAVTAEEVETLAARIEQAGNREMIDNPSKHHWSGGS